MMKRTSLKKVALICLTAALLASCSRSPRVTFYTLAVSATAETVPFADESMSIGPVSLPDLLDRPQLVVRTSANTVDILETHRWGESLKSDVPRVIAGNLSAMLKPTRVTTWQQGSGADARYRIPIDIQRLELTEGKGVALEALWSIRTVDGEVLHRGRSNVNQPAAASGYDALVAAQSQALMAVSRDLAEALRKVVTTADKK
jgi:uncharacterized lipoprotein YmbA